MSKKIELESKQADLKLALMEYWQNIAINIFEWKGLDQISDDLTSEIIERQLYENGLSVFFKDPNYGYMCLKASNDYGLNVYDQPVEVRALGRNYSKGIDLAKQGVLIKDTPSRDVTTKRMVELYVDKLVDIELTKDIHRNAHKTPIVIETSADAQLTARNVFKDISSNEPIIFKNKTRGENEIGISVINTNVPYINDALEDDYRTYVARILTILGLDNYVEDKKERVQSAEVESNTEYIISSFRVRLEQRQKACEKINELYGTTLSVEYVKGEEIEKEDENNGELHDRAEEDSSAE